MLEASALEVPVESVTLAYGLVAQGVRNALAVSGLSAAERCRLTRVLSHAEAKAGMRRRALAPVVPLDR